MEVSMCRTFLMIGNQEEFLSSPHVLRALTALGEVAVFPPKEALEHLLVSKYDMVIIDATMLDSEMLLLSQIRARQPDARLLVLTASPTWRRARDVLKAGAMDYMSKSLSEKEYLDTFQELLNRTPLP
jgi:DNA-binding NarL/FixJ family response regulator